MGQLQLPISQCECKCADRVQLNPDGRLQLQRNRQAVGFALQRVWVESGWSGRVVKSWG